MTEALVAPAQEEERRTATETFDVDAIPEFRLVDVFDARGARLEKFRGVQRLDTDRVVSIVSDRYQIVQHRTVAGMALEALKALEAEGTDTDALGIRANAHFAPSKVRLFAGGSRMEIKVVVGKRYELSTPGKDALFPGFRIRNSMDGSLAVSLETFAVRLACTNQLWAGGGSYELSQVHVKEANEILGELHKGLLTGLTCFKDALGVYEEAVGAALPREHIAPRLAKVGFPDRHGQAIMGRAVAALPEQTTRWDAYQVATDYLTHAVEVSPTRERQLDRMAAAGLLLPEREETALVGIEA